MIQPRARRRLGFVMVISVMIIFESANIHDFRFVVYAAFRFQRHVLDLPVSLNCIEPTSGDMCSGGSKPGITIHTIRSSE